jgi:hypothetical protein
MNNLFTKYGFPMVVITALIVWAWISFISVLLGKLF